MYWCISVGAGIDLALVLFSVNDLFKLTIFLPRGTGLIAQIRRFVRYALTGVWTVYVAPIVFLRTGLALLPQDGVCVGRSENDTTGPRES